MHEFPFRAQNPSRPPSSLRPSVRDLIAAGRLEEADRRSASDIAERPDQADAQYARGLVLLVRGESKAAIPWLEKAKQQRPTSATSHTNLGIAYRRVGRLDEACAVLERSIQIQAGSREAHFNLGCVLRDQKRFEEAREAFMRVADQFGETSDVLSALGDVARHEGNWRRALRLYQRSTRADAKNFTAWNNLAPILMHLDRLDEAAAACEAAIALDPSSLPARMTLGGCRLRQEDFDAAMDAFADAYEIEASSPDLCVEIGRVFLTMGEFPEAASWFGKAIEIEPTHLGARIQQANWLREAGDAARAVELFSSLLEEETEQTDLLCSAADAHWEDGDAAKAIELLERAAALEPGRAAIQTRIASISNSSGDVDRATSIYQSILKDNPDHVGALSGLATNLRGKLEPAAAAHIEDRLEKGTSLRPGPRASLESGLAYYFDGQRKPDSAAGYMKAANANNWTSQASRGWRYENTEYEAHIDRLIQTFDRGYFDGLQGIGNPSEQPAFIVGMPRSGTTLTEQILARHSGVLGVGERPFASRGFTQFSNAQDSDSESAHPLANFTTLDPERVAASAQLHLDSLETLAQRAHHDSPARIVDKMPDNYQHMGWIKTLFPNARIIYCRRDPRDVALSCWMTQFGQIRWASHTEHLVHRIEQHRRLMQHWRETIPDGFLEIDYEALVSNQESESRRLIEYLGLEWEANCLSFYESDRLVRTASITQVREPIYTRSVAKWERYGPLIPDLFDPLTRLVESGA